MHSQAAKDWRYSYSSSSDKEPGKHSTSIHCRRDEAVGGRWRYKYLSGMPLLGLKANNEGTRRCPAGAALSQAR